MAELHSYRKDGQPLPGILHGPGEPIFEVLPQNVLANFRSSNSENARLWNLIYPLARPTLSFGELMKLEPLWGTVAADGADDDLKPFFWGHAVDGAYLAPLREAVLEVDGAWPGTEVDLALVGERNLVLVEAKVTSRLGRCARYAAGSCPEIHSGNEVCRYWLEGGATFGAELEFGHRPAHGQEEQPLCHRHYQLARTLLIGGRLAEAMGGLTLHLWLLTPRRHWRGLKSDWTDFAGRVREPEQWRRLRALAWEDLSTMARC